MKSCARRAPSARVRARCSRSIARASSPAPAATCRCSPRRRNSRAAPAGRVFISRSTMPSARPKTAPLGCCGLKFTAAAAAAISVTSLMTGRSRPACATAWTALRWSSIRPRRRRPDYGLRSAIVARSAIVPRSSDRGFSFKYLRQIRFLFWHNACDSLLRLRPWFLHRRAARIEFGDDVMGIFGALTTSVAGLRSQAYALENISGNIANSQTTAFKRIDTSFLDLIPQTGVNNQLSGSVTTQSRETNTVQGDIQTATKATFMAISGNGFFVTQKPGSFTDSQPVFSGIDNYTRRGDFTIDKNGFLVNGAGYYLEGIPIDPTTGNVTGSVPQVLKFANDFIPAQPTTGINYRANLASYPFTSKHDKSVPGSELLRPADFSAGHNPRTAGTPPTPFADSSATGSAQNNKAAAPIGVTTLLSGGAATNSIATNSAATDTVTVN